MNPNMAYSAGHVELYNVPVQRSFDPTQEEFAILQEVAARIGIEYVLSCSLRAKGSWAKGLV